MRDWPFVILAIVIIAVVLALATGDGDQTDGVQAHAEDCRSKALQWARNDAIVDWEDAARNALNCILNLEVESPGKGFGAAWHWESVGRLHAVLGDQAPAAAAYARSLQADPDNDHSAARSRYQLAVYAVAEGRSCEAATWLENYTGEQDNETSGFRAHVDRAVELCAEGSAEPAGIEIEFALDMLAKAQGGYSMRTDEAIVIWPAAPNYPESAWQAGEEGEVVTRYAVSERGFVEDVRVVSKQGRDAFAEAAIEAAQRSLFRPAFEDDEPVRSEGHEQVWRFTLDP